MTGQDGSGWVDSVGRLDEHPLGEALVAAISQVCGSDVHLDRARALLPLLEASPGHSVLEVGCGTGAVARELARLTAGRVRIAAIDPSRLILEEAARETAEAGLGPLAEAISYRQMDGRALSFPNGAFAAAYCSRVLIHAAEPERVVAEMARVVQPGGRVLCIEPATQLVAGVDDALRRRVSAWTNPDVARGLLGIMRRVGLRDVTVLPHVQVVTEPPDVAAWREEFVAGRGARVAAVQDGRCTAEEVLRLFDGIEASIRNGGFLECAVHFAVLGRKAL